MDIPAMPFVAVIGGLWQLDAATGIAARATAKTIGAELAKARFGLVVYFSDDSSLEPHVVSGYVANMPEGEGSIRVRYARSQRGQIKFQEETARPELFHPDLFPGEDWEAPFYQSLAEAEGLDAVLLLGGATSTLIAGQIAIARGLPVLAIDQFGGSAAKIWNQLAQSSSLSRRSWGTHPAETLIQQLKDECADRASKRQAAREREQIWAKITSRRAQALWATGAFASLLVWLFMGMVYTPYPGAYPLIIFLGLISAGATGSLVRAVIWGSVESDVRISLLLGGVAGFVVGLAYLIPQWIGAPGLLEPKAVNVSATDKIQFASAVLVAVSAGVGFDTVFTRLQDRARDLPIDAATSSKR